MKQIAVLLIILVTCLTVSYGQKPDDKQMEAGRIFLYSLLKGQNEKCWQLFDKTNVRELNKGQFDNAMRQFTGALAVYDTFELSMTGMKLIDGKEMNLYSYKAISKSKNVVDDVLVDLLFFKSSLLVAGVEPRQLRKENQASTTKGKETPIEGNSTAVIDNISYKVTGVNIVHFEKNQGLLVIQIQCDIPDGLENSHDWGKKEAVKFAKYLVKNGYVEKAKIKAKEINRPLLDDIAVSFLDPSKGGGFNVILKPDEYR